MKTLSWMVAILILAPLAIVPSAVTSQEVSDDEMSGIVDHMHDHLDRITGIKTSIIMGNLEGVREPAKWLAEHEAPSSLPDNYEPFIEAMRSYAGKVLVAPDFQTAADAVSGMAITCSGCHQANKVTLKFDVEMKPEEWGETKMHMQRHQWGVDRMWEGLMGPSDEAWSAGTDILVDIPLHPYDVAGDAVDMEDTIAIDVIAQRLHALGGQGAYTHAPAERQKMYGEVLSICADCHTRLDRGPGE